MLTQRVLNLGLLLSLLLLSGCEDDSQQPFPILPDGAILSEAGVSFLIPCDTDEDCLSGPCITIGDTKRCSRACGSDSPCPPYTGWSCNSQSICVCSATGKRPDLCNTDGDCDGQPDRRPVAETCNGEDDDCNGTPDDVAPNTPGATQYFRDADTDGFGDDTSERWLCAPEPGWVTTGDDCDDTREEDNPGAEEICGDTYDNNCDGNKDDPDVCGRIPPLYTDVNGSEQSGVLTGCAPTSGVASGLDITQIVAKQDANRIKFTVMLAGMPSLTTCSSYTLRFGDPKQSNDRWVYIYRPAGAAACGALPTKEAYLDNQAMATSVENGHLASDPGQVDFLIEKTEIFPHLPSPTYRVKACSNAQANALQDRTACSSDSCQTPVMR